MLADFFFKHTREFHLAVAQTTYENMTIIQNNFFPLRSHLMETTQGHNLVQTWTASGQGVSMLPIQHWVVEFRIMIYLMIYL